MILVFPVSVSHVICQTRKPILFSNWLVCCQCSWPEFWRWRAGSVVVKCCWVNPIFFDLNASPSALTSFLSAPKNTFLFPYAFAFVNNICPFQSDYISLIYFCFPSLACFLLPPPPHFPAENVTVLCMPSSHGWQWDWWAFQVSTLCSSGADSSLFTLNFPLHGLSVNILHTSAVVSYIVCLFQLMTNMNPGSNCLSPKIFQVFFFLLKLKRCWWGPDPSLKDSKFPHTETLWFECVTQNSCVGNVISSVNHRWQVFRQVFGSWALHPRGQSDFIIIKGLGVHCKPNLSSLLCDAF